VNVLFECSDGIATITLNRPEAMNAMDLTAYGEITGYLSQIETDDDIRVGIITGAGTRAFSSGADLKTMHGVSTSSPEPSWMPWRADRWDLGGVTSKPLIAAVNGYALAGGLELALICDMRICSEDAKFGCPEVKWNVLHGFGAYQLPRVVGMSHAMDMLLTGRFVDAQEALAMGLVNRIVPSGDLMSAAEELARTVAGNSPTALRMTKELVHFGQDATRENHFRLVKEYYSYLERSSEQAEALSGFAEKR
jgi:enoyl-CoA hydratase/carnithine racemase